jgi:hypothetical protein
MNPQVTNNQQPKQVKKEVTQIKEKKIKSPKAVIGKQVTRNVNHQRVINQPMRMKSQK